MFKAIRGEPVDRIPYAPRLDLWYNANRYQGTLPAEYKNADLPEIIRSEGFGYHAVIPDFQAYEIRDEVSHTGLGIYNLSMLPVYTDFGKIEYSVKREGDETTVVYATPFGEVKSRFVHDEDMRRAGITIPHIAERPVKSKEDLKAVGWIFENMEADPNPEGYREYARHVGDDGIAVAYTAAAGSPVHHMLHALMKYEQFAFALADFKTELMDCAEKIGVYFDKLMTASLECPAEVYHFGSNFDAMITYPPLFEEHILPWLKKYAEMLHSRGKYLLCHTDSENRGLIPHYLASGMDIADSVCPKPMSSMTIKEHRDAIGDSITIMGGIPSITLLPGTMSGIQFEEFIADFLQALGDGRRIILGISDTTPPGADFGRIRRIAELAENFGPVT